jgi:hypothetical protein
MNPNPLIPETKLRSGFPWELTLKRPAAGQSVERLYEKKDSQDRRGWRCSSLALMAWCSAARFQFSRFYSTGHRPHRLHEDLPNFISRKGKQ